MSTASFRIDWADGSVAATRTGSPSGPVAILLAHGAGAGQQHPWMATMRRLLGASVPTITFDYAYTEAGRRSPDRMPKLLAVHRAAAERVRRDYDGVVLAGKSMGGRVASHLAGDDAWPAAALVYYGYPVVPMGKGEPRDTQHLDHIASPQLFFAGTRDRLSPPDLIRRIAERVPDGRLVVVDDGDHSFAVPKRSGRTPEDVLGEVAAESVAFITGM